MSAHHPIRGTWACTGCMSAWPCPTRQAQLLAEYDGAPVSLALLMGAAMVEAAGELVDIPAGALHRQFLGWLDAGR